MMKEKELKDQGSLFDIEKDGVYYKKFAGNCLQVKRIIGWVEYWKTAKHVGYDRYSRGTSYYNIQIPEELDGMKVASVEGDGPMMTNVSFPNTISSFGESLSHIRNVVFPTSVLDSHYKMINYCNDLVIPSSVQTIGTIVDCNNIELPNTVQSIYCIDSCNMLTIPQSVVSVGKIDICRGLSVLKIENPTPPVLTEIRGEWLLEHDNNERIVIFVPKNSLDAYKNDPMWGKIKTIREDPTLGKGTAPTPAKQTSTVKKPSEDDMKALDRLIDAALEDFVVTDEERATLLKKVDSIGLSRDEFKLILDSRIQRRMKEKPEEKIEEKKKGFFARLFGK